jgi:hypothetical protein
VSRNDFLIHRLGDIPRVAWEGMGLRRRWPETEGALGLWFAAFRAGRRQVSVSIWESPEDLKLFVRSPEHLGSCASTGAEAPCSRTRGRPRAWTAS